MFVSRPIARGLLASSIAFAVSLSAHAGAQTSPQGRGAMNRTDIQKRLEARFDALDTNKDGAISAEERKADMAKGRARMFARIDKDGNGSITREEFSAQRRGPGRPETPISKADFVKRRLAMFDRVDTNHDGTISAEERGAIRGKMRQSRGAGAPPSPPTGG